METRLHAPDHNRHISFFSFVSFILSALRYPLLARHFSFCGFGCIYLGRERVSMETQEHSDNRNVCDH